MATEARTLERLTLSNNDFLEVTVKKVNTDTFLKILT